MQRSSGLKPTEHCNNRSRRETIMRTEDITNLINLALNLTLAFVSNYFLSPRYHFCQCDQITLPLDKNFFRYVHLPPFPMAIEEPSLDGIKPLLKVKGASIEKGFEVWNIHEDKRWARIQKDLEYLTHWTFGTDSYYVEVGVYQVAHNFTTICLHCMVRGLKT